MIRAFIGLLTVVAASASDTELRDPNVIAGATSQATVRLELVGFGLIPTARVVLINPTIEPLRVSRTWTYEVIPQASLTDEPFRTRVALADAPQTYADIAYLPNQRTWLTFSPQQLFNNGTDDPIRVAPHKAWGHDHLLDLRLAKQARNTLVFIRLKPGDSAPTSDWERFQLPDVPDLPLIRFTENSRRLPEVAFERAAKQADAVFTATADDSRWTRILTLATDDPLAKTLPRLLLDGKSFHIVDKDVPCRYAVNGITDGVVNSEAHVIAVLPLK